MFQLNPAETIERVPIHTDADGVVRVAGTRVTLDTIVAAFDAGDRNVPMLRFAGMTVATGTRRIVHC